VNRPHRTLEVWKQAMDLVVEVYRATERFPAEERFGIAGQMRRCSVSIPSNIAEGMARHTVKETVQFLYVAIGSASELDTQLELSKRLGFLSDAQTNSLGQRLTDVDRMLAGLKNHMARKPTPGRGATL
jgi:four helix bundle protein